MFKSITQYMKEHPQRVEDIKWAARFGMVAVIFTAFLYMMLVH